MRYTELLKVTFGLPDNLGPLEAGNQVGLQVLYSPAFVKTLPKSRVEEGLRLASLSDRSVRARVPLLSNRIEIEVTEEMLKHRTQAVGDNRTASPLEFQVTTEKDSFELDEWIHCTLKIRNRSARTISIPNFAHNPGKQSLEGLRQCLAHGTIQIAVERDSRPIEMLRPWKPAPGRDAFSPSTELRVGDAVKVNFPLSWPYAPRFFTIDQTGNYTVRVTVDTTETEDDRLWKGQISTGCAFTVVDVPAFRAKHATESDSEYATARTDFYLARIAGGKGRYAGNVVEILKTSEGIPALISMLGSEDRAKSQQAEHILRRIHSPLDGKQDQARRPHGMHGWMRWWKSTGSKMSFANLWGNFDSHWQ